MWIALAREYEVARWLDRLLVTCVTSAPFFGLALCDVTLDLFVLLRLAALRDSWRFTIRDLMLVAVGAVGFVLPGVLFREF